jgi:hypothetical protein
MFNQDKALLLRQGAGTGKSAEVEEILFKEGRTSEDRCTLVEAQGAGSKKMHYIEH